MADPGGPIDFSDFSAEIARQTGVGADRFTDRHAPDDAVDSAMLRKARVERAPERDAELMLELVAQYQGERQRVFDWLAGTNYFDQESTELTYRNVRLTPMPSAEDVREALLERAGDYATKYRQGFTRLLIVPFGVEFEILTDAYQKKVKESLDRDELRDAGGLPIDLGSVVSCDDKEKIITGDVDSKWKYARGPRKAGRVGKEQCIAEQPVQGWQVLLVEDLIESRLSNTGKSDSIDFTQSVTAPLVKRTPGEREERDHLGYGHFQGEVGLTPESYLALANQHLCEHKRLLDTRDGSYTVLLGIVLENEKRHIYMSRHNGFKQLTIRTIGGDSVNADVLYGLRTAVPVDLSIAAERKTWVE